MDLKLRGRCAVVAASTSGLGLAAARALAEEGAQVVIVGRRSQLASRLAAELPNAIGIGADLTTDDAVDRVCKDAEEAFGGVDIVILNSGGPVPAQAATVEQEEIMSAIELILLPAVKLVRRTVGPMRARGWGRVIAIGSSGVVQPIEGLVTSNMARSALWAYLKTLAGEVAAEGVTVNMLIPGRLATERVAQLDAARASSSGEDVAAIKARSESSIPTGRYGDPSELGKMVAVLASDAASYVTGSMMRVDGGLIRSN